MAGTRATGNPRGRPAASGGPLPLFPEFGSFGTRLEKGLARLNFREYIGGAEQMFFCAFVMPNFMLPAAAYADR